MVRKRQCKLSVMAVLIPQVRTLSSVRRIRTAAASTATRPRTSAFTLAQPTNSNKDVSFISSMPLHMVVTRPAGGDTPTASDHQHISGTAKESNLFQYLTEFAGFLAYSAAAACLLISWEDLTCRYVLPSRHRTSLLSLPDHHQSWGAATVRGLGFGVTERQLLLLSQPPHGGSNQDPLVNLPSYNEIMLHHRTETVPQWKKVPTEQTVQDAIHTVTTSLQKVWKLQDMANDYQWENVRSDLRVPPLSDLPTAATVLFRQGDAEQKAVIGFDWGSCAWRHCGAVADSQEALDELEQLLGVLEPYEAVFCLDIVERSLRDILAVILWNVAATQDAEFYAGLPVYVSKISADDEDSTSRIDVAYLEALQNLRID